MKHVTGVYTAPLPHCVGDGFPVRSMFSYQSHAEQLSPFLLLDYAGPHTFAPGNEKRGVGEHPHRGFETVTIVYSGEVEHRDSTGRGGIIGPGDVQWMTAGAGILHEEFHSPEFTRQGGELEMVHPDGQAGHHLDWQFETAVPLRKNLMRLTAPNPGMMTGPGTNTYLIGDASSGYIVIDPGPDEPVHLQRLHDATGGDIRYIVCTHSHPDHSPGAAPLQALVVQSGHAKPPIMGLPSAPTARAYSRFKPEVTLQDGERITLTSQGPEGEITHTLQAIFTPGHAANHLCFLLEEDALLFSGDHILNGSTTVISPPDGNMIDYMDSLDRLTELCGEFGVSYILPAHGYVLGFARQQIAKLKSHRLAREAKVHAAMRSKPDGNIQDWVAIAYADTPPALWPVAERSLLAHVERIQKLCLGR